MPLPMRKHRNRYSPASETEPGMLTLRDEMNRLFDDFFYGFGRPLFPLTRSRATREFVPSVDLSETDGNVNVSIELPGMTENDIDVELDEEMLTISGEKKYDEEEEKGGRYWRESSYGSFVREIPLPAAVDIEKARASFKNGRLRVDLPKAAKETARRRKINVSPS
jgi:HSP20 family protein